MVSIFTGAGSGFERGSGSVLGGTGLLGASSLGRGGEQVFLNAANGNLLISRQDEFLVGRGPDVAIARTYNSLADAGDDNNDNWRQSTDRRVSGLTGTLNAAGSTVKRVSGDGAVITYTWDGAKSAYVATDGSGAHDTLTQATGVWTWTDGSSRITETYTAHGTDNWRIATQADTDGNTLTFSYTGANLTRITTANGDYVDYTWSGANITAIVTQAGTTLTRTRYEYDGANRLITVFTDLTPNNIIDTTTYATSYTYHGATKLVATISQTDGSHLAIAYDGSNRVATLTQTVASGVTRTTALAYGANYTTITDPTGQVTRLDYASGNFATEVETWGTSNLTKEPATIDGAPATKYTIQTTDWAAASHGGAAAAGDTFTFGLTLQAVGSVTTQSLGLHGNIDGWGTNGASSARIVSGPGQLVQTAGGFWAVSGLSTTQGTRIEITRTFTQAQAYGAYFFVDNPGGYRAGTSLIVADASLVKSSQAASLAQMDLGNWSYGGVDRTSAGTIDGGPAYQYTVQSGSTWAGVPWGLTAKRGDMFSYAVSLKAVGDGTSQYLGLYGDSTSWGANDGAVARIVSGPGTITQYSGGLFQVSGLSTTEVTRIEIVRTYTQNESGGAYMYVDHAMGIRAGASLIASAPHIVRQIASASANQLVKITTTAPQTGAAPQVVEFGYNDAGDLVTVKDAAGNTTIHTYDANGNPLTSTDRLGNTVTRTYGAKNELLTETRIGSDTTTSSSAVITDGSNATSSLQTDGLYRITKAGGLDSNYDASARSTQAFSGDFVLRLRPLQSDKYFIAGVSSAPEASHSYTNIAFGIETAYNGSLYFVEGTGYGSLAPYQAGDNVWLTREGSTINYYKGTTLEAAKRAGPLRSVSGVSGTFYFDTALYSVGAAADVSITPISYHTTRYVYDDKNHLAYAVTAEGRVTRYKYDGYGQRYWAAEYTDHNYAVSGLSTTTALTKAQLDSWAQDLPGSSRLQFMHTVFHDRGTVTGEMRYGVTAGGESESGTNYSHVYYTHDQAGQLLSRYVATRNTETFVYDGLGRLTASTDLNGGTTNFVFDDAQTRTLVTLANGFLQTSVYNKAGELISFTESGDFVTGGTADYQYDQNGRLRVQTDATPAKNKTYFLYDKLGRKIADINFLGEVVEYRYDATDRLVATVRYGARLGAPELATLADPNSNVEIAAIRPAGHGSDIWTWRVHDAEGRLLQAIEGDGSVTAYGYDASGRLVRTTAYLNKLGAGQLASFKAASPATVVLPTADARDSIARNFYDKDGNLVGVLDGEGFFTTYSYDKAGQKILDYAYATRTNPTHRATGSFWDLVTGLSNANDRRTWYVYDGQGHLRYTVDPINRVTEYGYESAAPWGATGLVRRTTRYAGTIAMPTEPTYALVKTAVANAGLAGNPGNRLSYNVYDTAERLAYTIDASGAVTGHIYDAMGQVVRTVSYATTYTPSSLPSHADMDNWNAVHGTDAGNRITRYYYSDRKELIFTVDAEGYVTRFDYDAEGRKSGEVRWDTAISVNDGTTIAQVSALAVGARADTIYGYRPDGKLSYVIDGEGVRTGYHYYANGLQAWEYRAQGSLDQSDTYFEYDLAGRLKERWDASGTPEVAISYYSYDGLGNLVAVQDPNGNQTLRTYDRLGRLLNESRGGSTTHYEYNAFDEVVKTTDARGHASYNYYDRLGRLTVVRDAEDHLTETSYTAFGEVASVKRRHFRADNAASVDVLPTVTASAFDATTGFEYDKLGRVTKATDAEGHYEQYAYNAFGNRTWLRNKLGGETQFDYNKRGLLFFDTVHAPVHDASGNVIATAYHANSYQYDARGNLIQHSEAVGLAERRDTHYVYDKADRLIETRRTAVQVLSQSDHLTQTSVVPTERIAYDRRGNVIEKVDANGARTLFWRDELDRVTVELDALGTYRAYTYDDNGNVLTSRVYDNQVSLPATAGGAVPTVPGGTWRETVNSYDALDRLKTTSIASVRTGAWNGSAYATSVGTIVTSFDYDANGNVVTATDANGAINYSWYDRLGRKIAEVDKENYLTTWYHDSNGNVLIERRHATRVAGTPSVGTVPSVANHADDRVTNFEYDRNGRRTLEQRTGVVAWVVNPSNGQLSAAVTSANVWYQYNGLGEVVRKTEATGDQTAYDYDVSGRLTKETRAAYVDLASATISPTVRYYYDGLGNLVRTRQGGATEAAGDRITTYAYGAGGRLSSMTDATGATFYYHYDAAGNKLADSYYRYKSDGSWVIEGVFYTRDLLGRVISQSVGTRNGSTLVRGDIQNMQYSAHGEVVRRGLNGLWQEQFAYDAAGQLWASNTGDGVWRYFVHDRNGNRTLTIESEGTDLANKSLDDAIALARGGGASIGTVFVDGVNATITVYDQRGLALQTILPIRQRTASNSDNETLVTTRTLNAFGEVTSETDARGNTTNFAYNTMGRLIEKKAPQVAWTSESGAVAYARPTETFYYDLSGRMIGSRDANGHLTSRLLLAGSGHGGAEALVVKEYHPDGGVRENRYDQFGDLRVAINELSNGEHYWYDGMGRVTTVVRRGGLLTDYYAYDLLGQRVRHTNSLLGEGNAETTDYDAQGRIVSSRAFGGDVTTTGYAWNSGITTYGWGGSGAYGWATNGGWTTTTTYANGRTLVEVSDAFDRVTGRTDLGGHVTWLYYDRAGRLEYQSNHAGHALLTTYYNTGLVASVSGAAGDLSSYTYDAGGNRISEYTTRGYAIVQNAGASYDALNRMVSWTEAGNAASPTASITWEYDLSSNIRRSRSEYRPLDQFGAASSTVQVLDHWYRFDEMNRVTTAKGSLVSGAIVGGTQYSYDAAGQRRTATSAAIVAQWIWRLSPDFGYSGPTRYYHERDPEPVPNMTWSYYDHDYWAQRRDTFAYNADGTLASVSINHDPLSFNNGATILSVGTMVGDGALKASYSYDAMGRLTRQQDWLGNGTDAGYDRQVVYNAKGQITSETVDTKQGADTWKNVVTNTYDYGTSASYALGSALVTETVDSKAASGSSSYVHQYSTTTTNTYAWYDGAVQDYLTYAKSGQSTYSTDYVLTATGQLSSVSISDGRPRTITFTNDMSGLAIRRDEADSNGSTGDPHEVWYRYGGKQLGFTGNNGTLDTDYTRSITNRTRVQPATPGPFQFGAAIPTGVADFDLSLASINSYSQGSAGGSYTVRAGETLSTIAANLWGDAALWYKLAEANGLSGNAALIEGRTLRLPAGVMKNTHNAATFKPYDPGDVIGETSPTNPKPKKNNKCGVFGAILLTVIAVAVTAITAGAALSAVGAVQGGLLSGMGAFLGGGMAGAVGTAGAIGIGAASAAVGSIVSQGVGVATGLQDKFSWKGVALSALSGGINGGMGAAFSGDGLNTLSRIGRGAFLGVSSSVLGQGVAVATGLSSRFDWAGVAAAGIGGAVSAGIGGRLGTGFGASLATNAAGGIANAATRSLANGTSFGDNLIAALPDVIGSTIGNALAGAMARGGGAGGGKGTASNAELSAELANALDGPIAPLSNPGDLANLGQIPSLGGQEIVVNDSRLRVSIALAISGGDPMAARETLLLHRGRSYDEAVNASSSAATTTSGRIIDGDDAGSYDTLRIGDGSYYWNQGMTSFGRYQGPLGGPFHWAEDTATMALVNADLAQFDRQVGLLGLAMVGGGAGGAAVSILAPMAGFGAFGTGALTVGGDGLVGGLAGVPMRSAFGAENSFGTFLTDSAYSAGGSLFLRGAAWGVQRWQSGPAIVAGPVPANPSGYSVLFEMQLNPADFGRSRAVHFNRANTALDDALGSDIDMLTLFEGEVPGIGVSIARTGGRETPSGWTWEHASTSTAGGQAGVMRLVPSEQHTPGSPWWRALHPDPGARGGYSEWAIPAGAPRNR
jgi:YD repeat-containing protein